LAAGDERTTVAAVLTPGQAHDAPVLNTVLAAVPEECPVEVLVADRAYDSDAIRQELFDADIIAAIPSRANRIEPVELESELYAERNRVERLVGKLKQFRRVATRYDKLAATFLAFVQVTAAFVAVR
jgi:putative transposase